MAITVTFKSENVIKFEGLAADTKPTPDRIYVLAFFKATDTFERWIWDGEVWIEANIGRSKQEFRLDVDAIRKGASPPADEVTESVGASGNIKIPSLAFGVAGGSDEEVFFIMHAVDHLDNTANVQFHILWKPDQNYTTGDYRWVLEFLVKDEHEGDLSLGTPTTLNEDVTPSNANDIIETEWSTLIDANADDVIFCRLSVDKSESSADGDAHLMYVEIAFTVDKIGELFE